MKILLARIEHLNELVPLFDGYRKFYRQDSDLDGARKFLKDRLELKESIIFLAIENEKAIGFTQLFQIFSSVSMEPMFLLNDLFVEKDFRGKGVGQSLINAAKELCIAKKYKGLALQTETTNPAQHLYEHLEFKKDPDLHYFWTNTER